MRIGSSDIRMESSRSYWSLSARRTSIKVLAGNAGLRMDPEAEDGTGKESIMGEDAREKFYGKEAYAEQRKELEEEAKGNKFPPGSSKTILYTEQKGCAQHGKG